MKCNNCSNEFDNSYPTCPKCGTKNPEYVKPVKTINPLKIKSSEKTAVKPIKTVKEEENKSAKTKKCPYCAEEILFEAKKCKHCSELLEKKSILSADVKTPEFTPDPEPEKLHQKVPSGIAGFIILAVILFFLLPKMCGKSELPKETVPTVDLAQGMAQVFVQKQLKAPSTAKFSYHDEDWTLIDLGNNRYKASSFVDSQNSFGAMLRTRFTVIVKYTGNDKWYMEDVKFYE